MKNLSKLVLTLLTFASGLANVPAFCMDVPEEQAAKGKIIHLHLTYDNRLDDYQARKEMENFSFSLVLKSPNDTGEQTLVYPPITMSGISQTIFKEMDIALPKDAQTIRFFAQLTDPNQVKWMRYPQAGNLQEFIYSEKQRDGVNYPLSISELPDEAHLQLQIYGMLPTWKTGPDRRDGVDFMLHYKENWYMGKNPNFDEVKKASHKISEQQKEAYISQLTVVYNYHAANGVKQLSTLSDEQKQQVLEQAALLVLNKMYLLPDTAPLIDAWKMVMKKSWD